MTWRAYLQFQALICLSLSLFLFGSGCNDGALRIPDNAMIADRTAAEYFLEEAERFEWDRNGHIAELDLTGTKLTEGDCRILDDIVHLKRLSLIGSRIDDGCYNSIGRMSTLTAISLAHTQTDDDEFAKLSGLEDLKLLDIRYTLLSDSSVDIFIRFKELEHLFIEGCNLSTEAEAQVREALPNCRIQR